MKEFLKSMGISYQNLEVYERAVTHASYAYENHCADNEELEFLGDAVIELLMSDYLYQHMLEDEGTMTKKRAQAVREEALVVYAKKIKFIRTKIWANNCFI